MVAPAPQLTSKRQEATMPKTVAITEVPAIVRSVLDSPHKANADALREYLDAETGEQALVFDKADGVTEENLPAVLQALRNAAKAAGHRLRVRWTSAKGHLFVVDDGAFVPMNPEKAAARAAKRAATTAAKATAAKPAKGH